MVSGTICALACSGEITTPLEEESEIQTLTPLAPEAPPMAEEVDGECIYRRGTYAVTYTFDEPPRPPCQAFELWTDETVQVVTDISLTNLGYDPVDGTCGDSNLVVRGCNVTFDRFCELERASRRVLLFAAFEYDFAAGAGHGSLALSIYRSTSDTAPLIGECSPSVSATLQRL